jgi:hypothetical protein
MRQVAFATALFLLTPPPGQADDPKPTPAEYAKAVMDKADKAKSVKTVLTGEVHPGADVLIVYHEQPGVGSRVEERRNRTAPEADQIVVTNVKRELILELNPKEKTAVRKPFKDPPPYKVIPGSLRQPADITRGGEEKVAGRATAVLNGIYKQMPGGVWTMWVDPKTDLPIRVRWESPGPKGRIAVVEMEYADWGKEFDPKLFATEVPTGYKLVDK